MSSHASSMVTPQPASGANPVWVPKDPDYAARVRASFDRQGVMRLIGARLTELSPGYCRIELPFRPDLAQQHGFIHAGIVSTIVDSAGGFAGFTLFAADSSVLTAEYKLNLLAPAVGERLIAVGEVVKPGRTLVITRGEVYAEVEGKRTLCAIMQQTLMVMAGKPDKQADT